jgi:hypothetical protein
MCFSWYDNPEYITGDKYDLTEQEIADMEKYNLREEQACFRAGYRMECGQLACDREYPNCIQDCFASSGSKSLLTGELIEACMDRPPCPLQDYESVIIGVDPSRLRTHSGIAIRQGKNITQVLDIPPMWDAYELAQIIARLANDTRSRLITVDSGNLCSDWCPAARRGATSDHCLMSNAASK